MGVRCRHQETEFARAKVTGRNQWRVSREGRRRVLRNCIGLEVNVIKTWTVTVGECFLGIIMRL